MAKGGKGGGSSGGGPKGGRFKGRRLEGWQGAGGLALHDGQSVGEADATTHHRRSRQASVRHRCR